MEEFDFIGPNDHPALLAITLPDALEMVKGLLVEMAYKVHVVDAHAQFQTRWNQVNYEVVILEENFAGSNLFENPSLQFLQSLPMNQRRHATTFLVGDSFESLNTMQAFTQSVHTVLNFAELPMLMEVMQKTIAEND